METESFLFRERWSPYWVGAGIGILSWITFSLMNEALGVSTTFVRVVGLLESTVIPGHVEANSYLAGYIVENPAIEWQMFLVLGLLIGAFVSARMAGSFRVERVPSLWSWRFGESRIKRYSAAFLGGVLVLFGARMAGGCTSGHGLSGGMQLAVSSWVFFLAIFGAGLVTAFTLFGRGGQDHV